LYASYTKFEKQFGTQTTLETTVFAKRRIQYEEEVKQDGLNYDAWFDYTRLEETALRDLKQESGTEEERQVAIGRVRELYERAVAHVPPGDEKKHWRRYIFLWLDYALFEEIETRVRVSILVKVVDVAHSFLVIGLCQSTASLSDSNQVGTSQAVYIRQALGLICQIRGSSTGFAGSSQNFRYCDWGVSEGGSI